MRDTPRGCREGRMEGSTEGHLSLDATEQSVRVLVEELDGKEAMEVNGHGEASALMAPGPSNNQPGEGLLRVMGSVATEAARRATAEEGIRWVERMPKGTGVELEQAQARMQENLASGL